MFIHIVRKLFAKVLGREISCLTAWRVPECLGWPKTAEYDQITRLYVLIKTLNQKMSGGKKFIYQPRIWIQKENLKSKPKKIWLEKGLFFWVTLIQAVVQNAQTLLQNIFLFTKYQYLEKISLFLLLRAEKTGGFIKAPPPSFSFVKYPRPLRVKGFMTCLLMFNVL